jgi:hypothetical protein
MNYKVLTYLPRQFDNLASTPQIFSKIYVKFAATFDMPFAGMQQTCGNFLMRHFDASLTD